MMDLWKILCEILPNFKEEMLEAMRQCKLNADGIAKMVSDSWPLKFFNLTYSNFLHTTQISKGCDKARSNDTSGLKLNALKYINFETKKPLDPGISESDV